MRWAGSLQNHHALGYWVRRAKEGHGGPGCGEELPAPVALPQAQEVKSLLAEAFVSCYHHQFSQWHQSQELGKYLSLWKLGEDSCFSPRSKEPKSWRGEEQFAPKATEPQPRLLSLKPWARCSCSLIYFLYLCTSIAIFTQLLPRNGWALEEVILPFITLLIVPERHYSRWAEGYKIQPDYIEARKGEIEDGRERGGNRIEMYNGPRIKANRHITGVLHSCNRCAQTWIKLSSNRSETRNLVTDIIQSLYNKNNQ